MSQMEHESAAQVMALERALMEARNERDQLVEGRRLAEEQAETLRRQSAVFRASLAEQAAAVGDAHFPRESSKYYFFFCFVIAIVYVRPILICLH